jgi:hypothetical protein
MYREDHFLLPNGCNSHVGAEKARCAAFVAFADAPNYHSAPKLRAHTSIAGRRTAIATH